MSSNNDNSFSGKAGCASGPCITEDRLTSPTPQPTLEEVLVSFQKSLARTTLAATNAGKADPGFLLGERTLYVVDGLEVELHAGVGVARRTSAAAPDRVLLDFQAPPDARSSIRFRVTSKPITPIPGPEVVLAQLDVLGAGVEFRAWMCAGENTAQAGAKITVHVVASDPNASPATTELIARPDGTVAFTVDPASGRVSSTRGGSATEHEPQRGDAKVQAEVQSWFVWVTAEANGKKLRSDTYVVRAAPEG
jgi:hypothetical protein